MFPKSSVYVVEATASSSFTNLESSTIDQEYHLALISALCGVAVAIITIAVLILLVKRVHTTEGSDPENANHADEKIWDDHRFSKMEVVLHRVSLKLHGETEHKDLCIFTERARDELKRIVVY
ncbi:uncharacterized protein LOC136031683 isoform X2 [Artemia franciscana]|uniref:Transmembrane protein n=1 Tax=Artemia franciscana TaxID=6661 RepID=A0AA88IRL8_ARTSF|nr:hypothetical protein QYM36_000761 [Artemia franciscana]